MDYIYGQDHGYSPALSASHLDDHYDYDFPASSPNLPPTPSYRGSPYTTQSELEPFDGSIVVVGDDPQDYNPTEYDAPSNNHSPLLNFMHPHVSLTPPAVDGGFEHSFDHSSPASSNGLQDQESETRSRASSVSSHSQYQPSPPPIPGFESLGFGSPHWNTSHLPADGSSPPSQKPPSPPSLVIPDASPSMNSESLRTRPPLINAPQGDGGVMNGPQLHIVPATPVSGGVPPTVPFINDPAESAFFFRSFFPSLPFISITSTFRFAQLLPLQHGTQMQPPRISHSIPRSTPISIARNQTPSNTTWFLINSGLVASLIRRPDRQRGMSIRSTLPPPIIGPMSTSTTSSPPLVHSLRDISSSPPTLTSPGSPTPPNNPEC